MEVKENKTYRHFKGNVYKVLFIGYDGENNTEVPKKVVIYKANHDGKIYVRSYENFTAKVDKVKYPNSTQEYRFEEVD